MKQVTEVQVNVYSVVRFRDGDDQDQGRALHAYLYSHTTLHQGYDLPSIRDWRGYTMAILKTTVTDRVLMDPLDIEDSNVGSCVRAIVRNANSLAQNQIDRFSSGLYARDRHRERELWHDRNQHRP